MTLKKVIKLIVKSVFIFVLFMSLYLVIAFVSSRITINKEDTSKDEISIYILTNGVHTDLVLPIRTPQIDWSKTIKFDNTISKDSCAQFVALGWGDKGFYLETPEWTDLKASVAFNAITGLGTSAMHATFYSKMNESKACKKIWISQEQYQRLINYVSDSFQKDANSNFININTAAIYGQNDAFYEAKGSYSMFYTCNSWANNGLKICGQKCCLWTLFDTGIFLKYQE